VATTRHLVLILIVLLASACAVYEAPIGNTPQSEIHPVRAVFLEVMADEHTKEEVRERLQSTLRRKNVGIALVAHQALADVEVSCQFDGDAHCIDCGPEFNRDWWWTAHLRYKSGEQVTLWGHVPKLRGRPEPFFIHQLVLQLQGR
jgi:hypothetical protein